MSTDIKIEIETTAIAERKIRSKEGKEFHIREQPAWAHLGKAYPVEFRIALGVGKNAFPKGTYLLDPSCLYVDRYGKLTIGRLELRPL
jgi:hypothetical protein